ncbi:hypothetical protein IAG25_40850 [Caballeronia sp. EK]|uniref:hypothetical protein n=1 Tax=Caballeronia sp. EK TaxID=2767469 RepID=UPI0019ADAFB5|nr:hypothetical protein [Caballeronia sp. EK]MBC8643057.1 hypothetical protein [Caballeronia sp. EK]
MTDYVSGPKIVHRAKCFGNPGGIKDLVLSMLTFGIYAIAKLSVIKQKERAAEEAIRGLHDAFQNLRANPSIDFTQVNVLCQGGGDLFVEEVMSGTDTISSTSLSNTSCDVRILFDGKECARLPGMTLNDFAEVVRREVAYLREKNGVESDDVTEY